MTDVQVELHHTFFRQLPGVFLHLSRMTLPIDTGPVRSNHLQFISKDAEYTFQWKFSSHPELHSVSDACCTARRELACSPSSCVDCC